MCFNYLHHLRQKPIGKAFEAVEINVHLTKIRLLHLEDSMVMYGIYNAASIKNIIETIDNNTSWNEKLSSAKIEHCYSWDLNGREKYIILVIRFHISIL